MLALLTRVAREPRQSCLSREPRQPCIAWISCLPRQSREPRQPFVTRQLVNRKTPIRRNRGEKMAFDKKFPEAKKRIGMFLQSEEGKITREQAITTATTLLLTASFFAVKQKAEGAENKAKKKQHSLKQKMDSRRIGLHGSHASHGSHCSHGSHASHGSHSSHGSHGSHSSHGSHGSHASHASHASHGSHGSW